MTGVQTCALPIYLHKRSHSFPTRRSSDLIAELKDIKFQKIKSDEIREEVKLLKKDMETIKPAMIILTFLVSLIAMWAVPKIFDQLFAEVPLPKEVSITHKT